MPRPLLRSLAALLALALLPLAAAQGDASQDATALLREARAAALAARDSGAAATPDQPLWREAIRLGEAARRAAPDDPEVLRFVARTYSAVDWYVRAWEAWRAYLDAGGTLDARVALAEGEPPLSAQVAEAGTELGFARYQAGRFDAALDLYLAVLALLPDDPEALRWVARIHTEQGRPAEALPYWEALAELRPDDEGVTFYLDLTREQAEVGLEASDAFREGLDAYDEGDLEAALDAFETALEANSDFAQAAVWAGRSALELGRPATAERYWQRVLELQPDDARARYFLEVARSQRRWGVAPTNAFYDGQAEYEAGDLELAAESFEQAAAGNADYLEAWIWAARSNQELGEADEAIFYWQRVLILDPDDDRARFFLSQAQQQLAFGPEAGRAFSEALAAYQLADFATAEARLRDAVAANPEIPAAWGWLGRLTFAQARYGEAAGAYGRAAELDPDNDDYAFFAAEAARLAEAEP